jgi:hypothetical protein
VKESSESKKKRGLTKNCKLFERTGGRCMKEEEEEEEKKKNSGTTWR